MPFKLDIQGQKPNSLYEEYAALNVKGAHAGLSAPELARLKELNKQVPKPCDVLDDQGRVVLAIGSREAQIDRARHAIIEKFVRGTATPNDKWLLDTLGEERTALMTPQLLQRQPMRGPSFNNRRGGGLRQRIRNFIAQL